MADQNPIKEKTTEKLGLYIAVIAAVCTVVFAYTFKPTLDMNGDTSQYYIYATSLAQGQGYTEISTLDPPPLTVFLRGIP